MSKDTLRGPSVDIAAAVTPHVPSLKSLITSDEVYDEMGAESISGYEDSAQFLVPEIFQAKGIPLLPSPPPLFITHTPSPPSSPFIYLSGSYKTIAGAGTGTALPKTNPCAPLYMNVSGGGGIKESSPGPTADAPVVHTRNILTLKSVFENQRAPSGIDLNYVNVSKRLVGSVKYSPVLPSHSSGSNTGIPTKHTPEPLPSRSGSRLASLGKKKILLVPACYDDAEVESEAYGFGADVPMESLHYDYVNLSAIPSFRHIYVNLKGLADTTKRRVDISPPVPVTDITRTIAEDILK